MTYSTLDTESDNLAKVLQASGVGPENKVAVLLHKSIEATIAFLAILKAGGCVVPLDVQAPEERRAQIIRKAEVTVLLTSSRVLKRNHSMHNLDNIVKILIDAPSLGGLHGSDKVLETQATHDNAAFVLFTSGSTGIPKGVVIEHSNMTTALHDLGQLFKATRKSRWLQASVYTFDVAHLETFLALSFGGCLCILEENRHGNIAEDMEAMRVTNLMCTPTVANMLRPEIVLSLRTLILTGEPISRSLYATWAPRLNLFQAYGPTEGSVCIARDNILPEDDPSNLGEALGCCQIWITNPDDPMQLLIDGSIGEIIIGGPTVARHYINEKEKTAGAFISAPKWLCSEGFCDNGARGRLYRTGDLGYKSSNGETFYAGRRDKQVKLRGQRIELAETEHHLRNCPELRDAVVEFLSRDKEEPFLTAFVIVQENAVQSMSTTERDGEVSPILPPDSVATLPSIYRRIRDQLSRWLPAVMIQVSSSP